MKNLKILLVAFLLISISDTTFGQMVYHYDETAVVLKTASGDINGKLMTASKENSPIVLLIAGSGPTDMDGNSAIAGVRPNTLKLLAQQLSKCGISSLRFDKRGIASSKDAGKDESALRFESYVDDVKGWIDYLTSVHGFKNIVVAGHSEGSTIGMLACQNNPKVKGFISLAGAGRIASDLIEQQMSAQPESVRETIKSMNDILKKGLLIKNVPQGYESLYRASVQPYMISWYKQNPQQIIATLKIPILIVQGTTDIQITTKDAELLKAAATSSQLEIIENMNHMLKVCEADNKQAQTATYTDPHIPVDSRLVKIMCEFVGK